MEFICDPIKNEANIRDRGLPLLVSQRMFNANMLVREDTRKPYPERRYIGYNILEGRLMVVVFCVPDDNHIRIISFRKANQREQTKYKNQTL